MLPDGQESWSLSGNHVALQAPQGLSSDHLEVSPIDPQLSSSDPARGSVSHPSRQHDPSAMDLPSVKTSRLCSDASTFESSEIVDRLLPSYDVSDDTFDDAYVAFIFYCNPTIPLDTDTSELRKAFRSPPKSDGKNFSTFTLFELIRKLEMKEIKTWAQLAIDLGVEPPAVDKGQSAQKVQQYAVRLKVVLPYALFGTKLILKQRWMHAMHVDAFFEYLLHKSHIYWTQVPSIHDPPSEFGRDGVAPEEDLALRALLPETRPKRGRRKADDKDDNDLGKSPAQKARLHSPTLSEDFAMARASLVDMTPSTARSEWSAADARISFIGHPTISVPQYTPLSDQLQQWSSRDSNQTPFTPHPQSAITPRTANPFLPYDGEPQSAITPSSSRSRRRHGPAVSSAWPSSSNFSAGKLRGRPPSNRSVSDGPFSTFPANPNAKVGPTINLRDPNFPSTPVVDNSETRTLAFTFPDTTPSSKPQATKPSRLHLQVPERVGGAVRLATPPPTVLVNGESENSQPLDIDTLHSTGTAPIMDSIHNASLDDHFHHDLSSPTYHEMNQNGTNPRNQLPTNDMSFRNEPGDDRTNIAELEFLFIYTMIGADWFDHRGQPIETCTLDDADQIVKQVIRNLQEEATSKETFLINLAALAGGEFLRTPWNHLKMTRLEGDEKFKTFIAKWVLKFGATEGTFDIKINVPRKPSATENKVSDDATPDETPSDDWKKRYIELRNRLKERDEKVKELRKTVLNALASAQGFGVFK